MVEQGTHKPLVGSSTLPPGTSFMAWVYVLKSRSGRYYYGSTTDLARRLTEHGRGHTYTTARDAPWELVANCELATLEEARKLECQFKRWKNPARVLAWLEKCRAPTFDVGVGREFNSPHWHQFYLARTA